MNKEELRKKYQAYDDALSADERVQAKRYRKYTYISLAAASLFPALFFGLGSSIKQVPLIHDFEGSMILIGAIFCVLSLGLFSLFKGKDEVLRKYSLGRSKRTDAYLRPVFGDAAVRWGKTQIIVGYTIIISLIIIVATAIGAILFL